VPRQSILKAIIDIVTATVASFGATILATALYLMLIGEGVHLSASFLFGLGPALKGTLLAAPAALALSFARPHLSRTTFIVTASATAGVLGGLLGFWVAGRAPHVSAPIAAALLASTWAIAAFILSTFAGRALMRSRHRIVNE
jgi:hypothetical protein